MTNDPNSYKATIQAYKIAINQYQQKVDTLQNTVNNLTTINQEIDKDFHRILNSRGWQTLEKLRKFLPTKHTPTPPPRPKFTKIFTQNTKATTKTILTFPS